MNKLLVVAFEIMRQACLMPVLKPTAHSIIELFPMTDDQRTALTDVLNNIDLTGGDPDVGIGHNLLMEFTASSIRMASMVSNRAQFEAMLALIRQYRDAAGVVESDDGGTDMDICLAVAQNLLSDLYAPPMAIPSFYIREPGVKERVEEKLGRPVALKVGEATIGMDATAIIGKLGETFLSGEIFDIMYAPAEEVWADHLIG